MAASGQGSAGFSDLPAAVKVLIFFGIIVVMSGIYFVAIHLPMTAQIAQAKSDRMNLENEQMQAENRQREFVKLNDQLAGRQAQDSENQRVLPKDPEIPAFLQDLNRLGELSGLEFRLIEPRPEEFPGANSEESAEAAAEGVAPLYVRIPVSLQLRGRYHQVAKFFYNVSRLDRAISMENVELTNPEIVGDEVVLDVQVMATTFRRVGEEDLAQEEMAGGH